MSAAVGSLLAGTALLFPTASASAATAPTFDIVPLRTGFGPVTLSGTAEPNATVNLYEYAYVWGYNYSQSRLAQERANNYTTGGYVTTTANSSGRWTISRDLDSGHVFMVGTADGYSQIRKAALRVKADLNVTASNGTVNFSVNADPSQPGLPVAIQRYSTSGGWSTIASGATVQVGNAATYTGSVGSQPSGTSYYRAFLQGDDTNWADQSNYIVANYSENQPAGNGAGNGTPPGNPLPTPVYDTGTVTPPPATSSPTPRPSASSTSPTPRPSSSSPSSSPTPKPTTPKPTTPAPSGPAAGSVQFTRIQYNAPGVDRKTNTSINGEYFRLTNKTKKSINLKSWTVKDAAGNLYRFTTNYTLAAGKSVVVRTGKGTNTTATRYWGKKYHVWNNSGDTAYLRTDKNKQIDTCKWTKPGKGYTTC
ncbi:lamin tail domain-containing protein [Actinoplanes couchii]|uniref:lamin tail domain-containing protein n=1 Tax=Actinoplanes couchii TaxID=403638 RepID=UPI001EF18E01|nr:lamin tail domain-containing protein [Actinoplanes couchii]MDR6325274.1 cell division septation protein DedD [Actinoplanes couchii]